MFSVEALAFLLPTSDSAASRTSTPKRNGLKAVQNSHCAQLTYSVLQNKTVKTYKYTLKMGGIAPALFQL